MVDPEKALKEPAPQGVQGELPVLLKVPGAQAWAEARLAALSEASRQSIAVQQDPVADVIDRSFRERGPRSASVCIRPRRGRADNTRAQNRAVAAPNVYRSRRSSGSGCGLGYLNAPCGVLGSSTLCVESEQWLYFSMNTKNATRSVAIPKKTVPEASSYFLKKSRLIWTYFFHSPGKSSSGKMAFTGHSSTHRPQSMQVSGSM